MGVMNQTFDVRTIMILIRHDHQMTISKRIDTRVILSVFETENLLQVLKLDILYDLLVGGFSDIEQFTS
jgi:hypothetical protein